jgi:hypothetical protein
LLRALEPEPEALSRRARTLDSCEFPVSRGSGSAPGVSDGYRGL